MIAGAMAPKIEKNFISGITKMSSKDGVALEDSMVLISIRNGNQEGVAPEITYRFCHKWQPVREVTFKEVMNIGIDFLSLSQLVPPKIADILAKEAQSMETEIGNVNAFLYTDSSAKRIGVAFYKKNEYVRSCPVSSLFEIPDET